jgi:hypothetical protein
MTTANLSGLVGFTNDQAYTAPATQAFGLFPLGTVAISGNTSYTYAQAASALAAAATTNLTGAFATTPGSTFTHDVAAPGVASGQYFWAKRVVSAL